MPQVVAQIQELVAGNPELERAFTIWIPAVLSNRSSGTVVLPEVKSLEELTMTIDQRFEIWAKGHEQRGLERGLLEGRQEGLQLGEQKGRQEGEQKGRQEGRLEGEQLVLQRLLTKRFGPLPNDVLGQIRSASSTQIDSWLDRVLDAASLDEVFRVH
ncbi:MAG: DUF4351 domain-containing protein [Betaproteobacteria bacterium]|nr:DUF4351 domain-containing protein [Betaproteobacteria bacterium]